MAARAALSNTAIIPGAGAGARRGVSFMSFLRGIARGGNNVPSSVEPAPTALTQQETPGQTTPKHSSVGVSKDGNDAVEQKSTDADIVPMKQHPETPDVMKKPRKTMAELDEELRNKMSGLAGDGGEAGVEYEDGQPVAMKRSVKNNMFRYI